MTAKQYFLILSFITLLVSGVYKTHAALIQVAKAQQIISTEKTCCHKQTCEMHLLKNTGSKMPSNDSTCCCGHSDMPVKFEAAFSLQIRVKTAYIKISVPQFGQIIITKHLLNHSKDFWFRDKIKDTPITANKPADLCLFRL